MSFIPGSKATEDELERLRKLIQLLIENTKATNKILVEAYDLQGMEDV